MKRATPFVLALAVFVLVVIGARRYLTGDEVVIEERASAAPGEVELVEPAAPEELEAPAPEPAGVGREQVALEPALAPAEEAERTATLVVIARWDDDGTPAVSMGVSTYPSTRANAFLHRDRAITGPDGRATFVVRAPERLGAYLDQGESEFVELAPGDVRELVLTAERWAVTRGRVVDREGNPQADAEIWVSAGFNYTYGSVVARTRGDGRFEVPIGAANYIGARKVGHVPSHLRHPNAAKGEELELVLPLRGPAGRVVGVVRGTDGAPIANALVHIGTMRGHVVELEDGAQGTQAPGLRARSADSGRYAVDSVEPGRVTLRARAANYAVLALEIDVEPDRVTEVDIVLTRGITARGTVREPGGAPIEGVFVGYGDYGAFDSGRTLTAADGAYELSGGDPSGWTIVARMQGLGAAETTLAGAPGAVVEWHPVLDPGRAIHGVVRDTDGVPLEHMRVTARSARWAGGVPLQAVTASDGTFRITNAEDKVYALTVGERGTVFAIHEVGGVRPSSAPITIVIPTGARPSAYVKGRLVLPSGIRATLTAFLVGGDRGPFIHFDADTGEFADGPWPPGDYRLWIMSDDYPRTSLANFSLAVGETRDLGTLELVPTGKLVIVAILPAGGHAGGATVEVRDRQGDQAHWGRVESDAEAEIDLAPGSYVVRVSTARELAAHTVVEVASGATTRATLELVGSPRLEVALDFEGEELATLTLTVFDADGWPVELLRAGAVKTGRALGFPLTAGSYRVEAVAGDGRRGNASVQVTAGASPATVVLELR